MAGREVRGAGAADDEITHPDDDTLPSDAPWAHDRGEELERYRSIATLQHVVLVEPDAEGVRVADIYEGVERIGS